MHQCSLPHITYGPLSIMDKEQQRNLNKIYNSNDTKRVDMLRVRRVPFSHYAIFLRGEIC